jgi:hypothetical protein
MPSLQTLELGGFVDGELFSPDAMICPIVQAKKPEAMTGFPPKVDESPFVLSNDVKYDSDIFCVRGQSGAKYPENRLFRQMISLNKAHFDTLTTHEQESFTTSLWPGRT